ncbi:MAG: gamma-glutamyltransferase [Alphaproteobacteria bacterium]
MIRSGILAIISALAIGFSASALNAETAAPGRDFSGFIVTTTQATASDVGADIIRRGGSAADAAVAVQAVLGLIEPSSSGIGGGAFMVYRDAKTGKVSTYDGREVAPAATKGDQFLGADGKPSFDKWFGGLGVGVPGTIPMLALAHKEHGKLPWASLFDPAIKIANDGFPIDEHLHQSTQFPPGLKDSPTAAAYLFKDGTALPVGTVLHNPAYAQTMKALAKNPRALNEGKIAKDIVYTINHAFKNPQAMTLKDLSSYEAKERDPACGPYRDYTVCGMGLPSSGGIIILETLGMLQHFPLPKLGAKNPQSWHLIAEAERLAFADRAKFLGDSDVIDVPVKGLIDSGYLKDRAALIDPKHAAPGPREAGEPPHQTGMLYAPAPFSTLPSTTHFTIVDKDGNVASITSSIQLGFGSQIMVDGFFLNNELTDFSMVPVVNGKLVANAAAGDKRPLSSMSPTIVTDKDGKLVMAVGSPGGVRIIGYVVKALIGVLDWNMPMQDAIDLPNFMNLNGKTDIESGPGTDALSAALKAKGHDVDEMQRAAPALEGFRVIPGGYDGGTDKHRDGKIAGGAPL